VELLVEDEELADEVDSDVVELVSKDVVKDVSDELPKVIEQPVRVRVKTSRLSDLINFIK
jgi:hypothetical protein